MVGQNIDDIEAILLPSTARKLVTKDKLFLSVVPGRIELKLRVLRGVVDRPARECTRYCNNVILSISPINAERVQFEQLAAVVLIETGPLRSRNWWSLAGLIVSWYLRLPVVEIEQHRRVMRRCQQHVLEMSQDIGTNGVTFEAREVKAFLTFSVIN